MFPRSALSLRVVSKVSPSLSVTGRQPIIHRVSRLLFSPHLASVPIRPFTLRTRHGTSPRAPLTTGDTAEGTSHHTHTPPLPVTEHQRCVYPLPPPSLAPFTLSQERRTYPFITSAIIHHPLPPPSPPSFSFLPMVPFFFLSSSSSLFPTPAGSPQSCFLLASPGLI